MRSATNPQLKRIIRESDRLQKNLTEVQRLERATYERSTENTMRGLVVRYDGGLCSRDKYTYTKSPQ